MNDRIELDNQLCFALYAAARVTQGAYRTVLGDLGLTYPQWLVLLALWGEDGQSVTQLGDKLLLDSGTLSPLLRRLEARGAIERRRNSPDARRVTIHLTDDGWALREHAESVQHCLAERVRLTPDELITLRDLARRLVATSETAISNTEGTHR